MWEALCIGHTWVVCKSLYLCMCKKICFPSLSVTAADVHVAAGMSNNHVACVFCVATVKECVQNLSQEDDKENLVASLWGAERCLRVLESVSTA